jgi:hypothetical protein
MEQGDSILVVQAAEGKSFRGKLQVFSLSLSGEWITDVYRWR